LLYLLISLRALALFVRTLGKSFNGVSYNYKPFYSKTNSEVLQGRNLCYSAIFVPLSPTTKLQDNPLLAIRDCFFNMAAEGSSCYSNKEKVKEKEMAAFTLSGEERCAPTVATCKVTWRLLSSSSGEL
jgi:hypothetical protein